MRENDAISRSAVLENIYEMDISDCTDVEDVLDKAYAMIADAPALDVAPVVHARWVGGKYYNDVFGYEKTCTACQREYVVGFDYLFCPYCGAKMDGEEDG